MKFKKIYLVFSKAILLFLVFSFYAWSLETIVVSDKRFDSTVVDTPSSITVITKEEIRLSGVDHLVKILRNGGGVQVSDLFGDGTDANIGLRGFSSTSGQNSLIMIDGRRLNNADNGLPDLNSISVNDIEKIELVKSSMSTVYGDKAVGGVINIITKKPDSLKLQANARYGSFNKRVLFGSLENRHDSGIDYRLSIHRHLTDNFRDNNELSLTTVNARAGYQYSAGKIFFELQKAKENIALPGALFEDLLRTDRKQSLNHEDIIHTDTQAGRIGFEQALGEIAEFRMEYTNRFNDISGIISSAGNPEKFSSKRQHTELTPRLNISLNLLGFETNIYTGMDWFETDYLIQSRFGLTDNTQTQYGYYYRTTTTITSKLNVYGGFRHGIVQNNLLVDTLSFGRSLPDGTEIDDTANAFEAGFSYQLTSPWRVFAKLEKNYRFVTADEYSAIADNNFFSQLFGFGASVPLPQTQLGYSFEMGAGWQNESNDYFNLQLYRLDIDDEIVFDPVTFLNTNLGNTRRNGIILEGKYSLSETLSLSGSYSYLSAKFTTGNFDGKELTFLPFNSGRFSLNYEFSQNAGMYLEWLAQGKRRFDGDYANDFNVLSAYSVININFRYRVNKVGLSLQANNFLNNRYSDAGVIGFDFRQAFPSPLSETFYPAPGRHFMLSLNYEY